MPEESTQAFCPDCHEREFLHLYDDGLDSAYICTKCAERRDRKADAEDKSFERNRDRRLGNDD